MKKLTKDDLKRIKEEYQATLSLREEGFRVKVMVHMGTCGIAAGARRITEILMEEIRDGGVQDVIVTTSGCAGLCSMEPMLTVEALNEPPVRYVSLSEDMTREIFRKHIMGGEIVEAYALAVGNEASF
ncbi:MAG: (2Fe-2S) ferredoxin domain-containing protein [Nitrospirales bacterium]|nr:(2Fe-2S) ferredoxin domain-containing protein [Nitrospirales bacterium]